MKKILVIQTAFIGDAVLATAVLEKLHSSYPQTELYFLVRKGNEALFKGHPFIKEVLIWNKKEQKYRSLFALLKRIRSEKFDLVVNLHRFASSGLLTGFSGAPKRAGFNKNPFSFLFNIKVNHVLGGGYHETGRNHLLIRQFTDDKSAKPRLYPTEADMEKVSDYKNGNYVCMAPSSVWFTKQWPEERWVELAGRFADMKVYLLGGPDDELLCSRITRSAESPHVINLAGKLSFLESAALMKDAKMNFVNDSGPMHFASAVDAPTTAIFCSTVPEFGFFPLSTRSFVVQTDEELDCRPCGLHGFRHCPEGHFKCGRGITADQVLSPE